MSTASALERAQELANKRNTQIIMRECNDMGVIRRYILRSDNYWNNAVTPTIPICGYSFTDYIIEPIQRIVVPPALPGERKNDALDEAWNKPIAVIKPPLVESSRDNPLLDDMFGTPSTPSKTKRTRAEYAGDDSFYYLNDDKNYCVVTLEISVRGLKLGQSYDIEIFSRMGKQYCTVVNG